MLRRRNFVPRNRQEVSGLARIPVRESLSDVGDKGVYSIESKVYRSVYCIEKNDYQASSLNFR